MSLRLLRSPALTSVARTTRPPRLSAFLSLLSPLDSPPVAPESSYVSTPPPKHDAFSLNPLRSGRKALDAPPVYHLHIQSTSNNTITTFTNEKGNPVAWFSGGSCGFKKFHRSGYEAGYQCAIRAFARILKEQEEVPNMKLEVYFKGFGQGRDAAQKALLGVEGEELRPLLLKIADKTPIKIGGTRAPKARRL